MKITRHVWSSALAEAQRVFETFELRKLKL